jgi:hypothetical protein
VALIYGESTNTLQSKPSPAPDIEVELVGHGCRAFELTDLNPATSHYVWKLMDTRGSPLMEHLNAMPAADRKAFNAKYLNAWFTLTLNYDIQPTAKKISFEQAVPEIFDWLMGLPDDYVGDAFDYTDHPTDLVDVLRVVGENEARRNRIYFLSQLYIHRTAKPEPITFMTDAGGHVKRLVVDQVTEKLTKRYVSEHPMELLLTARRTIPSYPDDFEEIRKVVEQLLPSSSFSRVWFHASAINQVEPMAHASVVREMRRGPPGEDRMLLLIVRPPEKAERLVRANRP